MTASAGAWYRVGKVNVVGGSQSIVGVGTNWQSDVIAIAIGDVFTLDAKTWYEVTAVNNDTSITLDRGFEGSTGPDKSYAILRNTSGTILTRIAGQVSVQFNQKQLFLDELRTWLNSSNATEELTDSHGLKQSLKTPSQMVRDHDNKLAEIDAIHPYPWAMRKVEFEARRAANNEKFAASGFVHLGQQFTDTYQKKIGEGLYTLREISNKIGLGRNDTLGFGDSKTTASVINVSGVITELNHKGSGRAVDIKFPPAEDGKRTYDSSTGISVPHATPAIAFASETDTNKVVTDRVDMWGFEAFLREINDTDPFVYKNGLIQSQAEDIDGVTTLTDNVRPDTYFAWYEGDDSSTGKGVNWKTATEAQRTAIASNPDNNIYFDDATGKFYQWCIRGRSFAGVGNGEWGNIDAISGDLQFDSFNKITPTMPGPTKFSAEGNIGVFTANNNRHSHLLVCGTVNRLNQGAYHPSFNPSGAAYLTDTAFGDDSIRLWSASDAYPATSKSDCFIFKTGNGGYNGGESGGSYGGVGPARPDARYYDAIYASGQGGACRDMRYSAWGLTQEDFAVGDLAVKSGKYRGRELLKRVTIWPFIGGPSESFKDKNAWRVSDHSTPRLYAQVSEFELLSNKDIYFFDGSTNITHKLTSGAFGQVGSYGFAVVQGISSAEVPSDLSGCYLIFHENTNTGVAGEYAHTEVTGDFANILQCAALKEGWVGSWNPTVFTGENINHPFTKPIIEGARVASTYSSDGGETWSFNSSVPSIDYTRNKRVTGADVGGIIIYNYLVNAALTESSVTTKPRTAPSAILISDSAIQAKGLGYSLTGKINISNSNQAIELRLNQLGTDLETGNLSESKETKHVAIPLLSPANDSPAFKALNYNVEENQQGFINYAYAELTYDDAASDWGDDGKIHITDNQATRLDDNGNSVVYGTARIVEPLGWVKNDK